MRRPALILASLLTVAAIHAAQLTLTPSEIEEAVRLGQTRITADRTRFHARYRVPVTQPPVDFIDVVTPFRRVVIAADERTRLGDRSFGQRQAIELLNAAGGRFDFVIELTFHPQNTFIAMPEYGVTLVKDGQRLALDVARRPRFGARVEDLPAALPTPAGVIPRRGSEPMLGGTVIAQVDGAVLSGASSIDLVVSDGTSDVARAKIDLGSLR